MRLNILPVAALRRRFVVSATAFVIAFAPLGANEVLAQGLVQGPPNIRDLVLGAPISAQPQEFQEFACGTNGGPPSLPISGFADFARCRPEASGLREVQFRYDDELHYRALAIRDELRAEFLQGTRFGNFGILASVLFDDSGILRGIRAVTDDRVTDDDRRSAYGMAEYVRAIYRSDGWECSQLPPAEGETPIGDRLVKEDCRKITENGVLITTEARLLQRQGQSLIDPANGQLRPGYFISTGRMEMYEADADGNPIYGDVGGTPVTPVTEIPPTPADPVEAFLVGAMNDCPGCDLAGADLKRRNLAGADLSGANLTGATLHRAVLAGAILDGANLLGANLNAADLKNASLVGADLSYSLLFLTDAAAADFSQAILDYTVVDQARFTGATMIGVQWRDAVGTVGTNLAGADLSGADMTRAYLPDADFQRARLVGANLTDVYFFSVRLRAADLTGVTALRADFLQADLAEAIFVDADLTEARLLRARTTGIDLSGANLTETIMPDGRVGQ
ncbi:MAG: pentapeptide repeat-containing protein [Bauldia sp.]|nr:pentapeptide repeat-containing protein [Bauldia sp.]